MLLVFSLHISELVLFDHRLSLSGVGVMRMEFFLLAVVNKPAVCLFMRHLCYRARTKASMIVTLLGTA